MRKGREKMGVIFTSRVIIDILKGERCTTPTDLLYIHGVIYHGNCTTSGAKKGQIRYIKSRGKQLKK